MRHKSSVNIPNTRNENITHNHYILACMIRSTQVLLRNQPQPSLKVPFHIRYLTGERSEFERENKTSRFGI